MEFDLQYVVNDLFSSGGIGSFDDTLCAFFWCAEIYVLIDFIPFDG